VKQAIIVKRVFQPVESRPWQPALGSGADRDRLLAAVFRSRLDTVKGKFLFVAMLAQGSRRLIRIARHGQAFNFFFFFFFFFFFSPPAIFKLPSQISRIALCQLSMHGMGSKPKEIRANMWPRAGIERVSRFGVAVSARNSSGALSRPRGQGHAMPGIYQSSLPLGRKTVRVGRAPLRPMLPGSCSFLHVRHRRILLTQVCQRYPRTAIGSKKHHHSERLV